MKRLSISVYDEVEEWVRAEADRRGIYLSGFVQSMIIAFRRNERNKAMIEGLLEDAEFDKAFANGDWKTVERLEAASAALSRVGVAVVEESARRLIDENRRNPQRFTSRRTLRKSSSKNRTRKI